MPVTPIGPALVGPAAAHLAGHDRHLNMLTVVDTLAGRRVLQRGNHPL